MRAPRLLVITALLCVAVWPCRLIAASDGVFRFDCGTADSPVLSGAVQVTADTVYSVDSKYGWVGDSHREAFYRTAISEAVAWHHEPAADIVDGVASRDDLVFRVDLPNGDYIIEFQLGDLGGFVPAGMGRFLDTGVRGKASGGPGGPLYSMAIDSGGRRVATDVATRTYPHRGTVGIPDLEKELGLRASAASTRLGNHALVRFSQQVDNGRLVFRFHGDETTYRNAVKRLRRITDERQRRQSLYAAGGPFTTNSVLSITVRPAVAAPFFLTHGQLRVSADERSDLKSFATALNAKRFRDAERAIESLPVRSFADRQARILAQMWLAGHPDHEREVEMLRGIAGEIERAGAGPTSPAEQAELRALRNMVSDFEGGVRNFDQRTKEGQEVVTSMNRAEPYFARAVPGDPLYWKSQLYRARIWYSMDPNRNAQQWPRSTEIMHDLQLVYPENRWVRFYLQQDPTGWPVADHRTRTKSAPMWASEVHNFYNRMLDLSEWWITHRQDGQTGALGGEWGDDVEFMPLITYTSLICPDASPPLVEGTMRFSDGLWLRSRIVDEHNGFFHITSDAEHAAEFTGNVLGMMLHVRPGDPEYVERSLKTGKLMRDLWMGRNPQAQRLVRSSYLGAFHVPDTEFGIDSPICGRAMNPAWSIVELNRNPELTRLAIEYAQTLVELARSTEKGKPQGVLPGPVVYETGELGAPGTEAWWLAPPGPFQEMFSFPSYHDFRLQVLALAWRLSGDERYLEPIRQEAELIELHYPPAQREDDRPADRQRARAYRFGPQAGTVEWTARMLASTGVVKLWEDLQWEMRGTDPAAKGVLLDKNQVAQEARRLAEVARQRWPIMTDDATMTDRVAFPGCVNSSIWYSGARLVAQQLSPAVTYEGAGRDFAALVLRHNSRYTKLLYYGFHERDRDVTLRFWELQRHGTYRVTGGPDADGDDRPDEITIDTPFMLAEPSGGISLSLVPGQTYVLEVQQMTRGQPEVSAADPAIASRDIHYDPRGHLLVDVHNIGNRVAENIEVKFYSGDPDDGGKLLGRTIVSHIEPPNTLQPQIVRTGIEWSPANDIERITVVLDESNQITELFERNNRAIAEIRSSVHPTSTLERRGEREQFRRVFRPARRRSDRATRGPTRA